MSECERCGQSASVWTGNTALCMTCFELAMDLTSEDIADALDFGLAADDLPDAGAES